uniref:PCI domain-containing protein n=1 Tax=Amphora coffeiformis TaxID=265554 RepID=A0A7S3L0Y4_9STRA|mmetsp:Transcript_17467/g.33183  ORF Transcript_17467/g.33183 Transcript_17467/m.33183 type:complete len:514 (-) Transcript_17467:77-1618(-)|eukprot:scaffold2081_cov255-Amphora_coffeaeformis.AAC.4
MSDEEDEYEYDYDDASMGNGENDQFEYTDEEPDQNDDEVALENAYYNAKGLREENLNAAAEAFEQVITQETEREGKMEQWSYKALKQLCKLHLRTANWEAIFPAYERLLECVAAGHVSPTQVEKGIQAMLERVASLYQGSSSSAASTASAASSSSRMQVEDESTTADSSQTLALQVYDSTLTVFHPVTGSCPNERLWFKTNIKYGQLLYETNETNKLQHVLKDLQAVHATNDPGGGGSSTQSMEIYALQIQLYSRLKDHKRLRATFHQAMNVRGGIPHPRTLALIQELGGKMHMEAKEYEAAGKTFFQAFKSYDEAGDPSRLRCLKYLVLASMLHVSTINPFDSQEARPYRDDPEIVAMTNLVTAFHNNDIVAFEGILKQSKGQRLLADPFLREHVEDLLETIRRQVLHRLVQPYSRVKLEFLADALNKIPVQQVESLLVRLILDGSLHARIDRTQGVLLKLATEAPQPETETLDRLLNMVDQVAQQVSNVRLKESSGMGGLSSFRGMGGLVH